jgi:hypothetical protein
LPKLPKQAPKEEESTMTAKKTQYTAKLRATPESVTSRTRRSFPAARAVEGAFLLLLLAAAGYAQTVPTPMPRPQTIGYAQAYPSLYYFHEVTKGESLRRLGAAATLRRGTPCGVPTTALMRNRNGGLHHDATSI